MEDKIHDTGAHALGIQITPENPLLRLPATTLAILSVDVERYDVVLALWILVATNPGLTIIILTFFFRRFGRMPWAISSSILFPAA
jgi:hypothetical protein